MPPAQRELGIDQDQTKLFMSFVDALKANPAYLMIFAAIFMTYLFAFAAIGIGAANGASDLQRYGLLALVGETVLVSVVVVVILESMHSRTNRAETDREIEQLRDTVADADANDVNVDNPTARKYLREVINDVREALKVGSPTFHDEMLAQLYDFKSRTSGQWAEGTLHTDPGDYARLLRDLYQRAEHSVFATSNEQYMDFWQDHDNASQILRAHHKAYADHGVRVTRVFIFSNLRGLSEEHLQTIRTHNNEECITPRIFFADENRNEAFAEDLVSDFVIIDQGQPTQAIGITSSFDPRRMGAKWIFDRQPRIEQTGKWIRDGSISMADLERRLLNRG